jgi:hypothetical protein
LAGDFFVRQDRAKIPLANFLRRSRYGIQLIEHIFARFCTELGVYFPASARELAAMRKVIGTLPVEC